MRLSTSGVKPRSTKNFLIRARKEFHIKEIRNGCA